jgi:hypothetical protein
VIDALLFDLGERRQTWREETDMSTRRTSSPSGLADLSRWLEREGICADEPAAASTEGFFRRRRAQVRANLPASADADLSLKERALHSHRASATTDTSGPLPATR